MELKDANNKLFYKSWLFLYFYTMQQWKLQSVLISLLCYEQDELLLGEAFAVLLIPDWM